MNKQKAYRHGEILFLEIEKMPENLIKANQKEFLKGSHGHAHSFDNGELYLKKEDDFVFGYFIGKNTKLYHPEHGVKNIGKNKIAELPNGIYQLRRQNEIINKELKQIID